jgi:hypothetical protein
MWHNLWIWQVLSSTPLTCQCLNLRHQLRTPPRRPRRRCRRPYSGFNRAVGARRPRMACRTTAPTETSSPWRGRPGSIRKPGVRTAPATRFAVPRANVHRRRRKIGTTTDQGATTSAKATAVRRSFARRRMNRASTPVPTESQHPMQLRDASVRTMNRARTMFFHRHSGESRNPRHEQ